MAQALTNGRALVLLSGLALGLGLPAQAIVVRTGQVEQAQRAGAGHRCVVSLVIDHGEEALVAGGAEKRWTVGSAVYLGRTREGAGLFLSAAHLFLADAAREPAPVPRWVGIGFGTELPAFGPGRPAFGPGVPGAVARRVWLHPRFQYSDDHGVATPDRQRRPCWDLALLECPGAVLDAEPRPCLILATLHSGSEHLEQPVLEAEIAGFGGFSTHEDPEPSRAARRVYGGNPWVSHAPWMGHTRFLHGSSLSPESLQAAFPKLPGPGDIQLLRFTLREREEIAYGPLPAAQGDPLRLQKSHPNQAMILQGDSGGPLFLDLAGVQGLRLAGISSTLETAFLTPQPDRRRAAAQLDARPCLVEVWEPVMEHRPWIEGVQDGRPDPEARVFDLEPDAAPA